MIPRSCAMLIPVALAACAGGSTMRVAPDDAPGDQPVALAPAPEPEPDSSQTQGPAPEAAASTAAREPEAQGYAEYGGGSNLEMRRIGQWTRTGVGEARRLVIRDANAWAELWSELGVGDRPEVDFTRDVAVVVSAGERPGGGYQIAVDRVRESNGELSVEVVETAPGPNCITAASPTQPVDIVVVSSLKVRGWSFVERKEVRGCR
jgi:protease stability complex PrcB-like protein